MSIPENYLFVGSVEGQMRDLETGQMEQVRQELKIPMSKMQQHGSDSPEEVIFEGEARGVIIDRETGKEKKLSGPSRLTRSTVNDSIGTSRSRYSKKYTENFGKIFDDNN